MYLSKYTETQTAQQTIFNLNPVPNMDRRLSARTKQCMDIIISCLKDEAVTFTIYKYVNLP